MIGVRATESLAAGTHLRPAQILAPQDESNLREGQGQGTEVTTGCRRSVLSLEEFDCTAIWVRVSSIRGTWLAQRDTIVVLFFMVGLCRCRRLGRQRAKRGLSTQDPSSDSKPDDSTDLQRVAALRGPAECDELGFSSRQIGWHPCLRLKHGVSGHSLLRRPKYDGGCRSNLSSSTGYEGTGALLPASSSFVPGGVNSGPVSKIAKWFVNACHPATRSAAPPPDPCARPSAPG